MAKETILIGCRLPNGLILHSDDRKVSVKLNGTLTHSPENIFIPAKMFGETHVDLEFWTAWKASHVGFEPLKNRAVFEARSTEEAIKKAAEVSDTRTGFEPVSKEAVIDGVKVARLDNQ